MPEERKEVLDAFDELISKRRQRISVAAQLVGKVTEVELINQPEYQAAKEAVRQAEENWSQFVKQV